MTQFVMLATAQSNADPAWGHPGGWWIPFALLFWIGVVAIVAYLVTHVTRWREPSGLDRAKDILRERFARGEITPEEFDERLSYLS